MKRSERHHLKENAIAAAMARLQHGADNLGTGLAIAGGIALAAVALFGGYTWWSERAEATAGTLLAAALVVADAPVVPPPAADSANGADDPATAEPPFTQPPGSYPTIEAKMSASLPMLLEAADAYPRSPSGITARYRAAAALAALGRHDEAAEQYRRVLESDEGGVYGRMATLGLASAQMSRGSYDEAIALLEPPSVAAADASLPVDGVLMELGRAYRLAGRSDEARAAFQRIIDEFPTSLYFTNAERELQVLQIEG